MRQATAEQRERAEKKRGIMRELCGRLTSMSVAERQAFAAQAPVVTIEGRPLSVYNQCLLVMQRSTVTVVGGFRQWKQAGRYVRKGEIGLGIWCPSGNRDEVAKAEPATDAPETTEAERPAFFFGTVFDVSQTEAADATPTA
jgi:antirestriction protein ArdC